MNLQTHIGEGLWSAIVSSYESGNYSHAVVDAMHHLTDILREKSGEDGDGQALVGAALGGAAPPIRVNSLRTQTERNIQEGIEQILRGMYRGIRNPRSHESIVDTKETANAIIYFIDHILAILDASQERFTISAFLDRVFDQHFVQSRRYAEVLVDEIPPKKRLDVLIEMYRRRCEGDGVNLRLIAREILANLPNDEVDEYLKVISEELRTTQDDVDIMVALQMLAPKLWPGLTEACRLRVENIIMKSLAEGKALPGAKRVNSAGVLATWASGFLSFFDSKETARTVLLNKLSDDWLSQVYVLRYFLSNLPSLCLMGYLEDYNRNRFIDAISAAARDAPRGDLVEILESRYWSLPDDWRKALKSELPDIGILDEEEIPF